MKRKKVKKILITGALGHIGSALIRSLDKSVAREVVLIDNLESSRFSSLFSLPKNFSFKFIKEDVATGDLAKHLARVDIVIHLAATPYQQNGFSTSRLIEKRNFLALKRMADACLARNIKLLFPSTTSVYSSQEEIVDERCLELNPQTPHAQSKLKSEKYLEEMGHKGLSYIICRFGTVYGFSPGIRFDTAVNKFIWQAVTGEPVTVWKTAWKQKRPYLYLSDCIKAINLNLEKDFYNGEIYNVTSGHHTVQEVVGAIKRQVPGLKLDYIDSPIMNKLSYEVSCDKIKKLGFKPSGSLEKGVKETIKHLYLEKMR